VDDERPIIEIDLTINRVLTVKVDYKLLDEIDMLWPRFGFKSRSDFIRTALQFYISLLKNSASERGDSFHIMG